MASPLILAIDQGTSSTKALLVDGEGRVVSRASAPLAETQPRPGWVEQDPEELWQSVRRAVAACVTPDQARRVAGVGISNQRESLVLWERRTGKPLGPLLSWQDQRTVGRCRELAAEAELVRSVSGMPLDPMFSALKARWLLDTYGRSEVCLGTVDSWLLSRFGGEHVIEAGNASRTQLLGVETARWDPGLLELFGVPDEVLPRVVSSFGPFPAVRDLAPLPDGVPVLAVLGDSHAAMFAHAGWRPGVVKATYGTGSSVMAVGGGRSAGLCRSIAWDLGDGPVPAVEGNIRATGRTITWLSELLGVPAETLLAEAEGTDAGGVTFVPAFGGLGAPWWEPDATPVITGFSLGTRRAQLAAAALEAVAFQVEDVVTAVEEAAGQVRVLMADGGLTRSARLMRLQADLSGRTVARSGEHDLSALGAADAAGLAAGFWTTEELERRPRPVEEFRPAADDSYRRARHATWRAAVRRARPCEESQAAREESHAAREESRARPDEERSST
ncbi:Glycerol kinase [[Actinomadura] parvosata subsp. kistnae]|uniref:Glycerol kinase n=1 Tax=[Actinomadura] parvosata subsp. kistnae TaxID=1909395 RepID=A0A1V0AH02_9ACTN|nr:FGGY family carbohydrate kinase [Nonomuraea sp. ATCC 55076]AQZ69488.1 glycerol kinase [Nonomuraea sp. ATCC 55076]SPL91854.1 Glycerol kinase [Actinomadura parvosata subsp. kistnae]